MNRCLRSLSCFFTVAGLALFSTDAIARASHKPHAQKAHEATKKSHAGKEARPHRRAALGKNRHGKHASAQRKAKPSKASPAPKEAIAPLTGDLALVKEAIDLARKAKTEEATDIRNRIADPAAQKLVEWFILRRPETTATFGRYAAFIAAKPEWPSTALLRRRAEGRLWEQRSDAATVRGFIGDRPTSAKGKLALARVLLAEGDRDGAAQLARDAWRSDELSERLETVAFEMFRDFLNRDDHRARMDKRIGAKDLAFAIRSANRLRDLQLEIVKASAALT
jgi:soluble lytic murein transglycosylase